ncbi:MAG TPA: hypothetical protein VMT76_13805 [Puia sp.]|nr:hypothetical protein [Puia sp.]
MVVLLIPEGLISSKWRILPCQWGAFTVGISGNANYNSNGQSDHNLKLVFDLPLILNFNVGRGSTKETESRFGFFAEAVDGYHYGTANVTYSDAYGDTYTEIATLKSNGPVANAGVQIGVGVGTHTIEIRASYMKGVNNEKPNIFGIGAAFNF